MGIRGKGILGQVMRILSPGCGTHQLDGHADLCPLVGVTEVTKGQNGSGG